MGLGTILWNGTKSVVNGAVWVVSGALNITANTVSGLWQQGQALGNATHTLIHNPQARVTAKKMGYMLVYDVLPLLAIYYTNKMIQTYVSNAQDEQRRQAEQQQNEQLGIMAYATFLRVLSALDAPVRYYVKVHGLESAVRMFVLESRAASAFNSNKLSLPDSLCAFLNCNAKRELKGLAREPIILLGNELLCYTISKVPYGDLPAQALRILIYGRYITRQVTPERCERHKEMVLESVLSLGLGYYATSSLLDWMFAQTVGMPPALAHRTLNRLLLLLHVNLAAHLVIPIRPKDTPWYRDPLNSYERVTRFIADVQHDGLKSRIPQDFNFEGAKPVLPLSKVLKFFTYLLNLELPKNNPIQQPLPLPLPDANRPKESEYYRKARTVIMFLRKTVENALSKGADITWYLAVPPMFQSVNGFIKDPIVADHWIVIRDGIISGIEIINGIGRTGRVSAPLVSKAAVWAPETTAVVLNLKWGIPKVITRVGLKLSRKEDFWDLAKALKGWMIRHGIECEVELDAPLGAPALNGEKDLLAIPAPAVDAPPPIPPQRLETARASVTPTLPSEQLGSPGINASPGFSSTLAPDRLITRRIRQLPPLDEPESEVPAPVRPESEPVEAATKSESSAGVIDLGLAGQIRENHFAPIVPAKVALDPNRLFSSRRRPTAVAAAANELIALSS